MFFSQAPKHYINDVETGKICGLFEICATYVYSEEVEQRGQGLMQKK